jgi:molybdenum cofactor cytidylyltransferase
MSGMKRPTDEDSARHGFAGLVLAAGRATRMVGGSKLLCQFEGTTVIRRVASTALAAGLEPVVVVVGQDERAVRSALTGLTVRYATVPRAPCGRLVSVIAGVEALGEDPVAGAMILLGDEPGLTADHIRVVGNAGAAAPTTVLRAAFRDRPGHPVLLPEATLRCIPDLARGRDPSDGLWDLIVGSGVQLSSVPIDVPAPIDIDTRDDLARAVERESTT